MKVIIVGAGSAGLAAAYKLARSGKNIEVQLFEKGRSIDQRKCPVAEGKKCAGCKPCNIAAGIGGAGLFSDGKLMYSTGIGTNLPELVDLPKTRELIAEVEKLFAGYGIVADEKRPREERELETRANQYGIEYVGAHQSHVGSDRLPSVIAGIVADFSSRVQIMHEEVLEAGQGFVRTAKGEYRCDKLLIAPGRGGAQWIENLVQKLGVEYDYNPVDIGVRVEVPASIMEYVCSVNWDFKARIRLKNDDLIRTFCTCPYGFVAREDYGTYSLVNGHSRKHTRSQNTNFAFLIKSRLTSPLKNANTYAVKLAEQVTFIGGGRPIVQRLGDLRRNRRSSEDRIGHSYVQPTFRDATPGDIGMAMGYRFVSGIIEGLDRLNQLVPGLAQDHTLLYAPEIKFHGIRVKSSRFLESTVPGIYFAGDASGFSRGIVGAAATGFLVAEGIMGSM